MKKVKRYKKICTSWNDLYVAYKFFYEAKPQSEYKWIFRGENYCKKHSGKISKAFKSSLDKAFERFDEKDDKRGKIEEKLIRSFQRKAHLYSGDKLADLLESLALLRHFEGPARVLDWSYSFFVSVYWAVSRAKDEDNLVVWALNNNWLKEKNNDFEVNEIKVNPFQESCDKSSIGLQYLRAVPKLFIYAVNPYYLNERLSIQQGVLLVQGDITTTWGTNLKDMIKKNKSSKYGTLLWKININLNINELRNVLTRLHHINISQATLFPDLGGFAQSLINRIADPRSLGIED